MPPLIAGSRVFICDRGVALCNEILAQHPPGAAVVQRPANVSPANVDLGWARTYAEALDRRKLITIEMDEPRLDGTRHA